MMFDIKKLLHDVQAVKNPAAVFERVSTIEQGRDGLSLDAQADYSRQYIIRAGLDLVHAISVSESAYKTSTRKQFRQLLKIIETVGIKHLVFRSPDRLSRNVYDLKKIEDLIENHGLSLHFYLSGQKINQKSTADEKWTLKLLILMAERDSMQTSEKVRDINRWKVSQGIAPHRPPYGYGYDRKTHSFFINESEAETVRLIFKMRDDKKTVPEIVDYLNAHNKKARQGGFSSTTVHRILNSVFYAGQFEHGGQVFQGTHKSLCSACDIKRRVNLLSVPQKGRRGLLFAFNGLLRDYQTGAMFSGYVRKGVYTYYQTRPSNINLSEKYIIERLDAAFETLKMTAGYTEFLKELFSRAIEDRFNTDDKDEENNAARIAQLKKENKKLVQLLLDGFDEESIRERLTENHKHIDRLQNERTIQHINRDSFILDVHGTIDRLQRLPEIYFTADIMQKGEIARAMIDHIKVDPDNFRITWKEPFSFLIENGLHEEKKVRENSEMGTIRKISRTLDAWIAA